MSSPQPSEPSRWPRAVTSVVEVGGGIAFVALAARWSAERPVGLGQMALVFVATMVGIVVVHEGAHAAIGRLTGFRVFRVVIGSGPRWARLMVRGTTVELRGLPMSGLTHLAARDVHRLRSRFALTVLAGPLVPLALALAALVAWPADGSGTWRAGIVAFGITSAASALVPVQAGGLASDGLLLARTIRRDEVTLAALRHAHGLLELDAAVESGDRATVEALATGDDAVSATLAAVELRCWTRAVDSARHARSRGLVGDLAPLVENALAFSLAHRAGPGDLDEADALTTDLIASVPDLPGLADTRGLVLLRLGRAEEAVPELQRSAADRHLPPRVRAQVLARLAVARYAAGDPHAGRRDLARALAADPADAEVVAAISAVAAAELEVVRGFWALLDGDPGDRSAQLRDALGRAAPATAAVLAHLAIEEPPDEVLTVIARAVGRA